MDAGPKGLRLLSFDGGGIRGLAGLLVVLEMMQRLMFDLELRKPPRPCDYFEMATGSGTGGLNAILLGRLGFTAEDAVYHYIRIAKVAFSSTQIEPKQRVLNLRNILEDVLKDAGLQANAMMEGTDTVAGKCKAVICATPVGDVAQLRLLRSYRGRSFQSPACTIIDAALATLASPGNFEPITIEGIGASEDFVDSNISCSNPTLELLQEAANVFGPHIHMISIVSLGSGRENADVNSEQSAAARDMMMIHTHINIACERTHEDLQRRTRNLNIYFRFNPTRNISSSQTEEWNQVSFLKTQTTSYLQTEMVSQQLDNAISALHSKSVGVLLSVINTSTRPDVSDSLPAHIKSQFEDNFDLHVLMQQKTAPAQGAMHEKCLPGTRRPILDRIRQWADLKQSPKPIFWLCDSAGTGKSTIAVTMGEEWGNEDRLAGQFCFSSGSASTSSMTLFFPTVAIDMASRLPELRSSIADAFKRDQMLVNRGLAEQFRKLIVEPLKKISRVVILIIDAADECEASSRDHLLKLLVQQLPLIPNLKIFITSRPEHDIFPLLETSAVHTVEFQLQTTEITSNIDDISTYINHHLSAILSEEQCQLLVKRANGLFIWASTAKRELDPRTAFESTDEIFERLMSSGDSEDLSLLYHKILERAVPHPKHINFICQALGLLITIQEPISIQSLELFIPGKPVENLMRRLRSVLNFKGRDDPILFFHPTFREHLLSNGETFTIDVSKSHLFIASQCFSFMQRELKQDICGTGMSIGHLPNNKDIPERIATLRSCVTIPLLYSIKHWFAHVEFCMQNDEIVDKVLDFFRTSLLHWVEALSLSSQLVIGIKGLHGFKKRLQVLTHGQPRNRLVQVETWCNDTLQFIQTQQLVLEVNAFAIYSIVVLSAAQEGPLYNEYGQRCNKTAPKVLKGGRKRWPSHIVISGHTSGVNSIAISNNGAIIASGSDDKTLRMWDTVTGANLYDPIRQTDRVQSVTFLRNGTHIVYGLERGRLVMQEVATGNILEWTTGRQTATVNSLATSSDGMRLVSASSGGTLLLLNTHNTNAAPIVVQASTRCIYSVTFSPDDMLFASGGDDKIIRVWDGVTGARVRAQLVGHNGCVNCVVFSPNGETIASASDDATIRLWSIKTQHCIGRPFQGHSGLVWSVSFSPDGTTIASGGRDRTIRLWNVYTQGCISQLQGHTKDIRCIEFLPEGNRVASGSYDNTIRIWDLNVQQDVGEIQNDHGYPINGVAFSPCGTKFVTFSGNRTLSVWCAENGDLLGEMYGHTHEVNCLAFSVDGSTIASGSDDQSVRLWDTNSLSLLKTLQGHRSNVYSVAFSHDGSRIISGSGDETLRLWSSATGTEIVNLTNIKLSSMYCVAFSPDDTRIASGSSNGKVQSWSINGEQLHSHALASDVQFLTFSTDSLHILSACREELSIWNVSSSQNIARLPHFRSSLTTPLPLHIQHLKFDLTVATYDGYWQPSSIFDSILHYFKSPRFNQIYFDEDARTITFSSPSSYQFHIPADLSVKKWKASNGTMVFGEHDRRVTILDFSHLFL